MESITIIGAGGVRCCRNGDAFVRWKTLRARELANEPAIVDMVIEDDRIAKGSRLADTAEPNPDTADCEWAKGGSTSCFVENLVALVYDLNVLALPDGTVGVRRTAIASDPGEGDAVKVKNRSRQSVG